VWALYVTQNFVTLLFGPCLVCSYFVYVMKKEKKTPKKKKGKVGALLLHQLLPQYFFLLSFRERERERERL
jgi:hypothetical protein